MFDWTIKNGDEELRKEIKRTKDNFDNWFANCWSNRCTRERMLSDDSPVKSVYVKMTKPFNEVKKKYPYSALVQCTSCGECVESTISTNVDCEEYTCGVDLCKDCIEKIYDLSKNIK